jgi:uncharacterized membrane protein
MEAEIAKPKGHPAAALAYVLFAVTGIIFLLLEPYSQDEFVRFHARQSIVFTIAWLVVIIILSVFSAVLPGPLAAIVRAILYLFNIAAAIFWVLLMYKAFIGERYRIPELSDWADGIGL